MTARLTRPSGFALVTALFLLVVLALLGAFLVDIVATQHASPAMRIRAARADYAARAGMGWAIRRAIDAGSCGSASFDFSGTGAATLDGFEVEVSCSETSHPIGVDEVKLRPYYVIDVRAHAGTYGSPDFVSRSLQAKILGPAA